MTTTAQRGRLARLALLCAAGAALAGPWMLPATERAEIQAAQEPKVAPGAKDRDLQIFMRRKLAASNQILEGLCLEDLKLVAQGAKTLNEMSDAERWQVSNDAMYRQFSGEFRQVTSGLVKAAEENNLDRATLRWVDATMSCMECHRFVRGMRIAKSPAAQP
jgi:hypothetical protein